ncbi:MAG: dephospho-CoA kinase [Treponema sp.]|nr:dephospho-CoA kinase [Treponema sp.]
MQKIYCITGPMAAGKNLASSFFEKHGFVSVDADLLGHRAVEIQKEKILAEFSDEAHKRGIFLTDENGNLNRRALGSLVFSSSELLKRHEAIVFPVIDSLIEQFIESHRDSPVIINATVLYKVNTIKKVNRVIFIDAPWISRLLRARKRDKLKIFHIIQRFKAQKHLFAKYKISNADTVRVWNTGSKKSLEKRLEKYL